MEDVHHIDNDSVLIAHFFLSLNLVLSEKKQANKFPTENPTI